MTETGDTSQGFVWTDIQQEINGLLYIDRQPKLPVSTLKEIFSSIGETELEA